MRLGVTVAFSAGAAACADGPTSTAPAAYDSGPRFAVEMSDTVAAPGATVTVSVVAHMPSDVPSIGAFRVRLVSAPGALEYLGPAEGNNAAVGVRGDTVAIAGAASSGFARGRLVALRFRVRTLHAMAPALLVDEATDVTFADRRATFAMPGVARTRLAARAPAPDVVPGTNPLYGDALFDGVIRAADALAILTVAVGLAPPDGYDAGAADVTEDGRVTALDAQAVLYWLVDAPGWTRFRLGDEVGSAPVTVASVSPALLVPGSVVTVTGTNFDPDPAKNTLTLDTLPMTVTAATPTSLTFTVPADTRCRATRVVPLEVRTNGSTGRGSAPLQVATQRPALTVGETVLADAADFRCTEFAPTGGRYYFAVYYPSRSYEDPAVSFELSGAPSPIVGVAPVQTLLPLSAPVLRHLAPPALPGRAAAVAAYDAAVMRRRLGSAHMRFRAADAAVMRRARHTGARARSSGGTRASLLAPGAARTVAATPGAVSSLRVQDPNDYTSFTTISARTVWVGARTVIVEDQQAPLAGRMDSYYQRLGAEFEQKVLPILDANFGNILSMDANTDQDGRVVMLFTPLVNRQFAGDLAFVTACDLLTEADCPSSNRAEIVYAMVPTRPNATDDFSLETPDGWLRLMRGVLAHEGKHIVSNAERLSRGGVTATRPEEPWLEEATAQVASELYARAITNTTWKGNAGYRETVYCEYRPSWNECLDRPFVTANHFGFLYDYEAEIDAASPIGVGPAVYGGGWMLVRWAADRYAGDEASFFKALTQQTTVTGVENLEARTGQTWADMLGRWVLALVTDDYPGLEGSAAIIPGWNTRDVFQGMHNDFPVGEGAFSSAWPLRREEVSFGWFRVPRTVVAGSAAFVELTGGSQTRQMVTLHGPDDTPLPEGTPLRVAIMRAE